MIKSKLIAKIADKIRFLSEKDVIICVNQILNQISSSLKKNERIEIRGFGSFSLRHRCPRIAHNPKTKEKIITVQSYIPHFKPGKQVKKRINGLSK